MKSRTSCRPNAANKGEGDSATCPVFFSAPLCCDGGTSQPLISTFFFFFFPKQLSRQPPRPNPFSAPFCSDGKTSQPLNSTFFFSLSKTTPPATSPPPPLPNLPPPLPNPALCGQLCRNLLTYCWQMFYISSHVPVLNFCKCSRSKYYLTVLNPRTCDEGEPFHHLTGFL